jgi:peptidoglycan/LPS O-acetylase OafA/YrhL
MLEDYPLFQILRRLGLDSTFFVRPYAAAEPYWSLPIEFWLYVVFGYLFFFVYLRRGRPSWGTKALGAVALLAVIYHAATGYGQCLSLFWLLGALGPWAVSVDDRVQQRFGLSDRATLLLVLAWLGSCSSLMVLRGVSRGLDFYEFQQGLFLAGLLIGLVWLAGRVNIEIAPPLSKAVRSLAKQTYALYLTHNAVLTYYISHFGPELGFREGVCLVVACNLVAIPFYWLFDRHHKAVARWAKSLRWDWLMPRASRSPAS